VGSSTKAKANRFYPWFLNHFRNQGYSEFKADLEGYDQPDEISGYIPDLTCRKNDSKRTLILLEAETCNTIFEAHTEKQWTAFYNYAKQFDGEFHVVVPKTCDSKPGRDLANERLKQLRIFATKWWSA
jgi:hypothetical protein